MFSGLGDFSFGVAWSTSSNENGFVDFAAGFLGALLIQLGGPRNIKLAAQLDKEGRFNGSV